MTVALLGRPLEVLLSAASAQSLVLNQHAAFELDQAVKQAVAVTLINQDAVLAITSNILLMTAALEVGTFRSSEHRELIGYSNEIRVEQTLDAILAELNILVLIEPLAACTNDLVRAMLAT